MAKQLKIAYISITALTDSDLPLIHELSKVACVDYYMICTNLLRQGTVVDLNLKNEGGIFPGTHYPELTELGKWFDLNHVFVVNKPVNHDWEWVNFKVSWKWMKMLKRQHYDIIHLTWPLRYCSFPLYLLRDKMVITMHDPVPHSSNLTIENKFHRWCCMRFTPNFILLNKTQKREFMKMYAIDESKIFLSKLSIYTHLLSTKPAPPLIDRPYILYIGSIRAHKGIEYLCQAMMPIVKDYSDIDVVIAGKGQFYFDKTEYEENPRYVFINRFITNEELASLISHSTAVVCPYTDATQSGVIMSAFALNKPVVATNVGALSEMVEDGRHGFLVPPRDPKALEGAIRKIIQPDIAKQFADQIKADYMSGKRSWSEIATEMNEIYKQIILNRSKK